MSFNRPLISALLVWSLALALPLPGQEEKSQPEPKKKRSKQEKPPAPGTPSQHPSKPSDAPAEPTAPLSIVQTTLHDRIEDGPSIPSDYYYVAGQLMYLSFRVSGYQAKNKHVDLRWQIIATDPQGTLLWEPLTGDSHDEITENDDKWLPKVHLTLPLPGELPSGNYRMRIKLSDENAKAVAEHELTFQVKSDSTGPSDQFSISRAQFYPAEDASSPLPEGLYHPGDTLFVRFHLSGYALGAKNHFSVDYGLKILRPSGKEAYAEPKAASVEDSPYYPKHHLSGQLSLNLTADLSPGTYTLVILAHDNVGNTSIEQPMPFKVEK